MCTEFFRIWNEYIPDVVQDTDHVCQKLVFNINIYFSLYPITHGNQNKQQLERSMQVFKNYLETKGAALSQTTEFLPYYALPFIPDPTSHPSFKPLFSSSWSSDLKDNLQVFLSATLKSQEKPQLYNLFKKNYTELERERKLHSEQLKKLQYQLTTREQRLSQYHKRYTKIQADYHKLIGVAAELVDSLEDTVRGKMVTPEYLQDICIRLFASSAGESLDVSKPGTASSILRASLVNDGLPGLSESVDVPYRPSLDYEKIKNHLLTLPERKKAFLLQALRWNLTQAAVGEQRDSIVNGYIIHDMLGCSLESHLRNGTLELLTSPSEVVRQYLARLLNALASLSAGRSYLAQNPSLVQALLSALTKEPKTSLTSENILGTLQKLSLRRQMQSVMINGDLIQWLSQLLMDHDNLSDYTLEYSVALLMNLCLRSAGKRKCIKDAAHILRVLSDLLGHENQEIRPYVNGALYSILALPTVKEEARALGMEEILECFLKDDNPDMTRQIQFIIKQLNTDDPTASNDPESDDEDEEDDDDEGDAIDAELDKQEMLEPLDGELFGEELLNTQYSMKAAPSEQPKNKKKISASLGPDHPLTRPTTPGARAVETIQENTSRPSTTTIRSKSEQQPSRPSTSSKSRQSSRPTTEERPPSTRKETKPNVDDGSVAAPQPVKPSVVRPQYETPFVSRPKIPRTPDSRPRTSTPPPLGRSASPPRPTSKDGRPGTSSSRKSSHSNEQRNTTSR
ncbi:lisH domain-containing protein ARMC9-like isoform X2 [Orbicella faveolata]|nr:lisH domain-containing protein ARMC9-like isoform X2 [Orbicella faveolata]